MPDNPWYGRTLVFLNVQFMPVGSIMILLARGGMAEKPFNKHRAEASSG